MIAGTRHPLFLTMKMKTSLLAALTGALLSVHAGAAELLNVSYDPTRELYTEFNELFAAHWKKQTGETVTVSQSHGGSGKQSRSVADGLEADVVTLALSLDIDQLHQEGNLVPADWQKKLPNSSSPYTSTIVFIVRKGNPKGIKDWGDLVKGDTQVITPSPKTGGAPRWTYLAGWAWAEKQNGGDQAKAREFITQLYKHVPVLDTGARGSTTTFAQRKIGDVLLSWENEAHLIAKEFPGETEIVYPSLSILAEPPVAVVEKNTAKHGTTALAKAYLEYLYTEEAQDLVGKYFYRPREAKAAAKYADRFPKIELVTIEHFGGWANAQKIHFADGGIFDQIYGL